MKPNTFALQLLALSAAILMGCGDMDSQPESMDGAYSFLESLDAIGGENELDPLLENGIKLNGIKLNGIKLNGIKLNGIKLNGIKLNGSVLCAEGNNGGELCGAMLEGASLEAVKENGQVLEVRIDSVEEDASGEFSWHGVSYKKGNEWVSVCGEDEEGKALRAIALEGRWDMSEGTATGGDYIADPEVFTLACEGFVLSKCVALTGYYPWESVTEVNALGEEHIYSRRHLHQACTRMLRADYCGDGRPHTSNGTLVNSWDAFGLDPSEPQAGWTLEAEWSEGGAVCVNHARDAWKGAGKVKASMKYIQQHCPEVVGAEAVALCGSAQSTFYTDSGFDAPLEQRSWVRNDSATP